MQQKRFSTLRRALLFFLPPVTAFYLMQFVFGGAPWDVPFGPALANALLLWALHLLLCGISNRPSTACLLLHVIAGCWGIANSFVNTFRGTPVLPWDFSALGTAAAVAGTYRFSLTWRMWVTIALLAALWLVLRLTCRTERLSPFFRWKHPRPIFAAVGVLLFLLLALPQTLGVFGVRADVWDQAGAYRKNGALAVFLKNMEFMKVDVPDDTSPEGLAVLMEQTEPVPASGTAPEQKPNIVAIMNESWADFEAYGNLSLSESVTDYIGSLENAIRGHAYASVFGAGTSASEFEFLTGNSMAFLPSGSIPYQQYLNGPSASLASLLKEEGYRTLAFHPGEYTSWQRNQAYPRLGFDDYKCMDDMNVEQELAHGYISDRSDFEQVIYEFEHKQPDERLFLFNVTIQNHGSYTDAQYPTTVYETDTPGQHPLAEQYLSLVNESDRAFQLLVDYFSQQEEPTIIVMFGDHQPAVEQEFLDKAYGVTQDQMTMEQYMGKYQVPFVIWANYPLPEEELPITSLNFLGQHLLRYAGIDATRYGRFLYGLQTQLPAVTFVGYYDTDGKAYSHMETNDYTERIQEYQQVQYNNLFGGNHRQAAYFNKISP